MIITQTLYQNRLTTPLGQIKDAEHLGHAAVGDNVQLDLTANADIICVWDPSFHGKQPS